MLKLSKNVQNRFLARKPTPFPTTPPKGDSSASCRRGQRSYGTLSFAKHPGKTLSKQHVGQPQYVVDVLKEVEAHASLAGTETSGVLKLSSVAYGPHFSSKAVPALLGNVRIQAISHSHQPPIAFFSTTSSANKSALDNFRSSLERQFAKNPQYDIKSVFKAIKQLPFSTASAYEAAFDVLIRHKRSEHGATILLHMQKQGLLASNATRAKMMALSLSMALPDEVTIEDVVYNICEIVGHAEYTEKQLVNLLKIMEIYNVERVVVAVIVNYFRESRGKQYTPRLELVPDSVEALAREQDVEQALTMLEAIPATDAAGKLKSISIAYTRLLVALRETYDWDPALVERITRGIEQRKLPRQIPTTLLLAWAVGREKYLSVLEIYDTIQRDLVLDAYVYHALFEMYSAFNYSPKNLRFAPLAPRRLFHGMARAIRPPTGTKPTVVPDTALLNTALAGFMHQRDYAAALVALRAFAASAVALDNATFYTVVKPLVRRMWGDLAHRRRMRERQVKWGDRFLGAAFAQVRLSEALIARVLAQVARAKFDVADPLYAPTAAEALRDNAASRHPDPGAYLALTQEKLEARAGPLTYPMPTMELMETVNPKAAADVDVMYDATPLERLLQRAILAEILVGGQDDVDIAVRMSQDAVRRAEKEMIPGSAAEVEEDAGVKTTAAMDNIVVQKDSSDVV